MRYMKGQITSFRLARHHQYPNHMIVQPEGVETMDKAQALVGKTVEWKSPGKKIIKGKIMTAHGNKGRVRVAFETGMPGQAVFSFVEIK